MQTSREELDVETMEIDPVVQVVTQEADSRAVGEAQARQIVLLMQLRQLDEQAWQRAPLRKKPIWQALVHIVSLEGLVSR